MYAFYVTRYQMKRLNDALEFTLTSSLTSKRNMKKFSFLPKSSPVHACRPLQAIQALSESKRYGFGNNACENSGWSKSNFQDLPKKRNLTSTQHKFLFSCSKYVKLSYRRRSFCQFEADENTRKCG